MNFLIGVLPWLWHVGGAALTIAGLIALAVYVPILRKPAIALAIALSFGLGGYVMGDKNGANRVEQRWNAAIKAEQEITEQARTDAERDTLNNTPDELRNDKYNRDRGP